MICIICVIYSFKGLGFYTTRPHSNVIEWILLDKKINDNNKEKDKDVV